MRQRQEEDRQTLIVAEGRPGWHRAPAAERKRQSTQVASRGVGGGAVRETQRGRDGRQRHPEDVHQEETGTDQDAIHLEEEPSRKPRAAEQRPVCEYMHHFWFLLLTVCECVCVISQMTFGWRGQAAGRALDKGVILCVCVCVCGLQHQIEARV